MAGTSEGGRKTSEGGRGDPHKASPAAVEKAIKGINFPTSKDNLLKQAKNNHAQEDVLYVLDHFEDKEYRTPIDVSKEAGRVDREEE